MRSILDKALAALLEGNRADADKLFGQFVINRARVVNEAIEKTGSVDIDSIVDEEILDDSQEMCEAVHTDSFDVEMLKNSVVLIVDTPDMDSNSSMAPFETKEAAELYIKRKSLDTSECSYYSFIDYCLAESDSMQMVRYFGECGIWTLDDIKNISDAGIDSDTPDVQYGQCDPDMKIYTPSDRQIDEFLARIFPDAQKVSEGKLEITQVEDGTLNLTHHVTAHGMEPKAPVEKSIAPVATSLAGDIDFDAEFDATPLPGVEDLVDKQAFESLKESLADQLEKITAQRKDGQYAVGGGTVQQTASCVPDFSGKNKMTGTPVVVRQTSIDGFDAEVSPPVQVSTLGKTPVSKLVKVK